MKPHTVKKKYLIRSPKEVFCYLQEASPSYKSSIFQFQCDRYGEFGLITLCSENEQVFFDCLSDEKIGYVADVTEDNRYKNSFLKRFGFPLSYEFDLLTVYQKCEKLPIYPLQPSLKKGMSAHDVVKVFLYYELLWLKRSIISLNNDDAKAPKEVAFHAKNLVGFLRLLAPLFDQHILKDFETRLAPLTSKKRLVLLEYLSTSKYHSLVEDMVFFLKESSLFYVSKMGQMPIFFFVKKHLKKEHSLIAKVLKKSF